MKMCFRCSKTLEDKMFRIRGDGQLHNECIPCMNVRNTARIHKLKIEAINYLGGSCKHCGYNKNFKALEFHHLDPSEKDFEISKIRKTINNFENIKKELDKCIILCSNCHKEEHDEIWRKNINTEIYNKLISVNIWPNLLKETYSQRYPPKICPDCGSKNINKNSNRCSTCYGKQKEKIKWPSDKELKEMIWQMPRTKLSKILNVSDKAISKRCKLKNIEQPPVGYWNKKRGGG